VAVETSKGKAIITGLCCNAENFPTSGGVIAPGVHLDVIQAYDSMNRIKEAADIVISIHDLESGKEKSFLIHDQFFWGKFRIRHFLCRPEETCAVKSHL